MLSRAITLYATDAASGEAEQLLTQVIRTRSKTIAEGETAVYYLGRYYHRNYYMLKQPDALNRAIDKYKETHVRVDTGAQPGVWYAEARFYEGLAYLEQGKWKAAYDVVDRLRPELDGRLDIDYLVWSLPKKVMNITAPSQTVKERYLAVMNRFSILSKRDGQRDPRAVAAIVDALQRELLQARRAS